MIISFDYGREAGDDIGANGYVNEQKNNPRICINLYS